MCRFVCFKDIEEEDEDVWHSVSVSPYFEQDMAFNRFKDFRSLLTAIFSDKIKTILIFVISFQGQLFI